MFFHFFLFSSFIEITKIITAKNLSQICYKFFGVNGFFKIGNYKLIISKKERSFIYCYISSFKFFFLKKLNEQKFFCFKSIVSYEFCFYSTLFFSNISFGKLHPITQGIKKILYFFQSYGFCYVEGKEVETKKFNFSLLNISDDHSASSDADTFYFTNDILLRTHTSSVQIREMQKRYLPPFSFITIGRVYRRDYDITHTPMFFQTEGLVIGNDSTISYLIGVLFKFLAFFYNSLIKIRIRSSYFPFTEPSFEMDINCFHCNFLSNCCFCHNSGWVEILGAGCVHNRVLNNCFINFKKYSGFAFGLGIDRILSVYYKIFDIRLNFFNNLDYLEQF